VDYILKNNSDSKYAACREMTGGKIKARKTQ
jgi:hypothetical protein